MNRIGEQLLAERKLALDPQKTDKTTVEGSDLLSLLVRANTSEASHRRLSDEQVLARESGAPLNTTLPDHQQKFQPLLSQDMKRRGEPPAFTGICVWSYTSW